MLTKSTEPSSVESTGIGRPPAFDGAEGHWREWRGRITAFLIASYEGADMALEGGRTSRTIAHENIQMMCTHEEGQFRQHEYEGA